MLKVFCLQHDSTFEVHRELPATSTVIKNVQSRPVQTNLKRTELEITSIGGELTSMLRSVQETGTTVEDSEATENNVDQASGSDKSNNETIVKKTQNNLRRSTRLLVIRQNRISVRHENKVKIPRVKNEALAMLKSPRGLKKSDLKKAILEIMNTGRFNDLKALPKVGQKTAFQIISYRGLNGKFKTFDDLKEIPAMKGKAWGNFLEVRKKLRHLMKR